MKRFPQIDRFITAICSFTILALLVLLTSCKKDSLQEDSFRIKAQKVETAALKTLLTYEDCQSLCIIENSEIYYAKSGSQSQTNGQQKTISYNAYNTETQFIVEAKYEDNNSAVKANINIIINGVTATFSGIEKGSTVISYFDLQEGWLACDLIEFSVNANFNNGQTNANNQNNNKNSNQNSNPNASQNDIEFGNLSYSLIGICSSTCDESFSYEQNQNGSYTFTYVSSETLEHAEVKFTCPHIVDFESMDGKTYSVNPGKSKGSPTVLTWIGDVEACKEINFVITFQADCDQNSSGKANVFTDFKVNGESKKGDNDNIVFQCN